MAFDLMNVSAPCCGAPIKLVMPTQRPTFGCSPCRACGVKIWYHFCDEPIAYTEAQFHAAFEVDEEAKTIKARPAA